MKNRPLAVQIWFAFVALTLGITLLLATILPVILRNFFAHQIYETIEDAQQVLLQRGWEGVLDEDSPAGRAQEEQNIRTVNHLVLISGGRFKTRLMISRPVPAALLQEIREEAMNQAGPVARYSRSIQGETLFYVIRKERWLGKDLCLVSWMWDTYYKELISTLYKRLILLMGLVLLFSWVPAILLARYLTRPLVQMEKHVKKIAGRDWSQPLRLDRKDEIGRLAQSIERMRVQLARQDEAQKSLLQHISHELKTPVMVIRSYAQSVQDGIYPQGSLSQTVKVIEDEAERLEKRIRDLLYFNKLDYLSTLEPKRESIDLKALAEKVVDRLRVTRADLSWQLDLSPCTISGDREQWEVVFENLLENQMRYAASQIRISLHPGSQGDSGFACVRIWNDGPPIDESLKEVLFQPFRKGEKGEFGLGLAIVHKIVLLHDARIWAENESGGVAFYLRIPLQNDKPLRSG